MRQIQNNVQQKVQRVMQQHNTIQAQVETLQSILVAQQKAMEQHGGGHQRHFSGTAAHNHLDTIRKCNMRGIQLLHEIMEKNRRKRGSEHYAQHSGYSSHGGHGTAGYGSHSAQHSKRRSYKMSDRLSERPPSMGDRDHIGNASRHLIEHYEDDEDGDYSRHHTKSTRFSEPKGRGNGKGRSREKTTSRGFEFGDAAAVNFAASNGDHHPQSTRSSRGWVPPHSAQRSHPQGQHHHVHTASGSSRGGQLMANMQPLVLSEKGNSNHSNSRLLSVDENKFGFSGHGHSAQPRDHHHHHSNGSSNGYGGGAVREKRVSYDYVDGHESQSVHQKYPQRKSANNAFYREPAFDEQEEDEYVEEFRAQRSTTKRYRHQKEVQPQGHPQSHHNEDSLQQIEREEDEDEEEGLGVDLNAFFSKWWTVKFPRRSSKVGLFGGNKGHKTQITLDHQAYAVVLQCDASNNKLVAKVAVADIKNIEVSEKKNVSMFTVNGRKYKIKCQTEKEATTWFNLLNRFVRSSQ